jgi:hypothetical protein
VRNAPLSWLRSRATTKIGRAGLVLLASLAVADCSSASKPAADPDVYPANYKSQIAVFLVTIVTDRADFRASLIAAPAMKPVGTSQHYVACVQLNGHNQHKDKALIYLEGAINQYVDAKAEQCAGVAYEPFKELAALTP